MEKLSLISRFNIDDLIQDSWVKKIKKYMEQHNLINTTKELQKQFSILIKDTKGYLFLSSTYIDILVIIYNFFTFQHREDHLFLTKLEAKSLSPSPKKLFREYLD